MNSLRRALLRAIAIKLEVETHKKYRKVLSKIWWAVFIVFLGVGLFNSINRYLLSTEVLSDPSYLEVPYEEFPNEDPDKNSTFRYNFEINGQQYQQEFEASYNTLDKYLSGDAIEIAYKTSDPSKFDIAYRIEKNKTIGGIIKHFLLMFFLGGFGFLVIYTFFTYGIVQPIEDYEDEDEDDQVEETK